MIRLRASRVKPICTIVSTVGKALLRSASPGCYIDLNHQRQLNDGGIVLLSIGRTWRPITSPETWAGVSCCARRYAWRGGSVRQLSAGLRRQQKAPEAAPLKSSRVTFLIGIRRVSRSVFQIARNFARCSLSLIHFPLRLHFCVAGHFSHGILDRALSFVGGAFDMFLVNCSILHFRRRGARTTRPPPLVFHRPTSLIGNHSALQRLRRVVDGVRHG